MAGEKDMVVSVDNTIELYPAGKKYGVDHRYKLYSDVKHDYL